MSDDGLTYFADLLTWKQVELGLKGYQLAEKLGVSKQIASTWLNPKSTVHLPGDESLRAIADLTGIPYPDLLMKKTRIRLAAQGYSVPKANDSTGNNLSAVDRSVLNRLHERDYLGAIRLITDLAAAPAA